MWGNLPNRLTILAVSRHGVPTLVYLLCPAVLSVSPQLGEVAVFGTSPSYVDKCPFLLILSSRNCFPGMAHSPVSSGIP